MCAVTVLCLPNRQPDREPDGHDQLGVLALRLLYGCSCLVIFFWRAGETLRKVKYQARQIIGDGGRGSPEV